MQAKLDMSRAWNEAIAMLSANSQVVLVVAGVFLFLPNAISALFMPGSAELLAQMEALGPSPDPDATLALFTEYLRQSWWIYLLQALVQAVGVLGLLALLTDRERPTVGQALVFGAVALVPYLLGQILIGAAQTLVIVVPMALGSAASAALGLLLAMVGVVAAVYFWVKFSLLSPVIAIERVMNPLAALARSWRLTKGNSLVLFAFYALIILAAIVISLVSQLVIGIFGLVGQQAMLFASAILGSLITMGLSVVMLGVMAAVHRQLSGRDQGISKTFD